MPSVACTQEDDGDECCNDHSESACDCIGCLPTTLACEFPLYEYSPSLKVLSYTKLNSCDHPKCDFFDRLDRPPQILLL